MLKELLTYFLTPCSPLFVKMGYLRAQIAIDARHQRCREAWASHIENTKSVIIKAIAASKGRGRAVVLGSGHLLDVPLKDLAEGFDEVVLVDVAHPRAALKQAKTFANVRLEERDVSGVVENLDSLPTPAPPADLGDADLVISVNLLSQLGIRPRAVLEAAGKYDTQTLDAFDRTIVQSHLSWLRGLKGTVCLIADLERRVVKEGEVVDRTDLWHGIKPPPGGKRWTWTIAPRPEVYRDRDVVHRVVGYVWKGSSPLSKG